jgi:ATP-dependent helicase/nuclease subunit A
MAVSFYPTVFQHLATDYRRNVAVTAGAGTGKTAVLTSRIIKILARESLLLDRLLVLTFTDKAAVEMKERIYSAVDAELAKTGHPPFQRLKDTFLNNYISTFHAFCAALLREYPIEAGLDPYFRVLDESDKIFFLRKSIARAIKELAADRTNREIYLLSAEFSRAALGGAVFTLIQKREDAGAWLTDFGRLNWPQYRERLFQYRRCITREISYKLAQSGRLQNLRQTLAALEPPPGDDFAIGRKREQVIELLAQLQVELAPAASGDVDVPALEALKAELLQTIRLSGSPPRSWAGELYNTTRDTFYAIRYLLQAYPIEEFTIGEEHEQYGFELLKALAAVTRYCLQAYHDDKAAENFLDFQDLQLNVLRLFEQEKHRHILDELRERFRYVMVDEFQDTNSIQWRIVRQIAADPDGAISEPKLFVVGDEKQAIYSFRGGDVCLFSRVRRELREANLARRHYRHPFELTLGSEKDYSAEYHQQLGGEGEIEARAGQIVFSDNFRSAAAPINFFNMFFTDLLSREVYEEYDARPQMLCCSGNRAAGSVELLLADEAGPGGDASLEVGGEEGSEGGPGEVPAGGTEDGAARLTPHFREALLIVEKLKEVFSGEDEKYERVRESARRGQPAVAILLNRRTMIKTYEEALRRSRINFTVVRGRGFFQRQEIVDLGNLLSFLTGPADDRALVAFLRSPVGHLSDEGLFLLSKTAPRASLWDKLAGPALTDPAGAGGSFTAADRQALAAAAGNLSRWLNLAGRLPLVELLREILNTGGFYASFGRGFRGEQAVSNVEKLKDSAREIALQGGDLADFCQWLNDRIDYIEEEGEADIDISLGGAVQIMTVHQSKGLEFPMVFVPDLAAVFNLGERESLYAGRVPYEMNITAGGIARRELSEIGIDAPNPGNGWASEPLLVKRIIKKRQSDQLIAEKKRLFYVAATRAMDHLVLVGHASFSSPAVTQRINYAPLDQMASWMDWLNRILDLPSRAGGLSGTIVYGNKAGEPMQIPYRRFIYDPACQEAETPPRTTFPID